MKGLGLGPNNPADYRPATGTIPTGPGVYRFRDDDGRVVYVGKAKNLRSRLSNYFQNAAALHPRTLLMVTTAASVEWTLVRNDVEALILEHSWINEFDPRFNVVFKDDRSYPFVAITMNERFPRVMVMRGARRKGVRYFGPYVRAWAIRETVDTLLAVLPMRSCSTATFNKAQAQRRPCLLGYIGKCAAPCVGRISEDEHRAIAVEFGNVLQGSAKPLVKMITQKMQDAAEREEFEAAARARDQLHALVNVLEKSSVVLDEDTDVDVLSVVDEEFEAAAHVFHVRAGRIVGQRGWIIEKPEPLDTPEVVSSLVQQLYSAYGAEDVPPEVLVPQDAADADLLQEWLSGLRGSKVALRVAKRGAKAELAQTGAQNAAEVLAQHRLKRASDLTARSAALTELQEALGVERALLRIECYDISHTSGTNQVGSMVVFEDGTARKKEYRQFSIADAVDDLSAMSEVLTRRFTRYLEQAALPPDERESSSFTYPPQLVVVDGGLPQVRAAQAVITELGLDIPVIGLAKRLEEVWLPHDEFPVILPRNSEALYLLQRVRDEAHRFAITAHRKKRTKAQKTSKVDEIPGVGPKRARALIQHFGSLTRVKEAGVEQIALVPGVGRSTAESIYRALHPEDGMLNT